MGRRRCLAGLAGSLLTSRLRAGAALRIGALRGPQADLLAAAARLAGTHGLDMQIVPSDDGTALVNAVLRGDLHATASHNAVQLREAAGGRLLPAFASVTLPVGIYSRHVKTIAQLRDRDVIVLPSPKPENARARVLMYNYRLLFAHEDGGLDPDLGNIVDPRHFVLRDAAPAALAGQLETASAVLMPYDAAISAGLRPSIDSIGLEDAKSPYTQVVAVVPAERDSAWLARFARIFQSRDMRRYIYERYGDSVQPPW